MQSFSHQEKRAKIFSRESWPYLSNSLQTNLAILHDEYSYKNGGDGGRGWVGTLGVFNKDSLSCVDKK